MYVLKGCRLLTDARRLEANFSENFEIKYISTVEKECRLLHP